MAETRAERTAYLGLLALMVAAADSEGWAYPYWNILMLDAALNGLAQAPRDGTVPLSAPSEAPTAELSASAGSLGGGISLEIGQTFVDEWGRETDVGPLATVATGDELASPDTAATLGTPTLGGASGYEGGLLEVWFSWTDGAGGETLPSPVVQVDVPYQAGGLKSEVEVTLPSTPAVAGAAGANIYIRHRGGNIVLAYRIEVDDVDEITLTGAVADCYRSLPLANSAGSNKAIDITGADAPEGAALTRFYIRTPDATWTATDRRLKLGGADEWDPDAVSYPLLYTGATTALTAGFPPIVSQVKAIRPVDLTTEVIGTLPAELLPDDVVLETELVKTAGEGILSGMAVSAQAAPNMTVRVSAGEALLAIGRVVTVQTDLTIPTAPVANHRIDLICLMDDGVLEGPTENAALKGATGAIPAAPATPAGALCLAQILVEDGVATIVGGKITDERYVVPTLAAAVVELRDADDVIAGDLSDHAADAVLHASKAHTLATVTTTCGGSTTQTFTITVPGPMLVTRLLATATSGGALDYKLELFSNAGRTTLEYQAGEGAGLGILEAAFDDRVPWEWFGDVTMYGLITNNSADDITDLDIDISYRL